MLLYDDYSLKQHIELELCHYLHTWGRVQIYCYPTCL